MLEKIKSDVINILIPRVLKSLKSDTKKLFQDNITYHVNPTESLLLVDLMGILD